MKIHPSHEELYQLYVVNDMTAVDIAKTYGMHHTTLLRRLREVGIPIRDNTIIHGGKNNSVDTRKKISEANKGNKKWLGRHHTIDTRSKIRAYRLGKSLPQSTRDSMSITHKRQYNNPEFKNKMIMALRTNCNIHPNKPEAIVLNMFNEVAPKEWAFVGDGQFIIEGRNPDLMNVNGKKQLCEIFGRYWHTTKARCYEETEEGRKALFAKYGYATLVIWDDELKNPPAVLAKIADFCKAEVKHGL
jgi:hypothetical protein